MKRQVRKCFNNHDENKRIFSRQKPPQNVHFQMYPIKKIGLISQNHKKNRKNLNNQKAWKISKGYNRIILRFV